MPQIRIFLRKRIRMKTIAVLLIGLFFPLFMIGQGGTVFGIKAGPSFANQSWKGQETEGLFGYHAAALIETHNDSTSLRIFGQIGYHQKGSTRVRRAFTNPITNQRVPRQGFRQPFSVASLAIGAKNKHPFSPKMSGYYLLGLRLDYTIAYELAFLNFDEDDAKEYFNRFNYGVSLGGGLEFNVGNNGVAFIELNVSPDVSKQIFIPPGVTGYTDPVTNQFRAFPETKVYNFNIELSFGYKFIRRVVFVDDEDLDF